MWLAVAYMGPSLQLVASQRGNAFMRLRFYLSAIQHHYRFVGVSRTKIAAIPACKGPLDLGRRPRTFRQRHGTLQQRDTRFRLLKDLHLSLVNSVSSAELVESGSIGDS